MKSMKRIGLIISLLFLSLLLSSCTLSEILFGNVQRIDVGESKVLDTVNGTPLVVIATEDYRYGQRECYYVVIFGDIRIKSQTDHVTSWWQWPTSVSVLESFQNDELKAFRLEQLIVILSSDGCVELIPESEYEQNRERIELWFDNLFSPD